MSEHTHAWRPVANWSGRYRCASCGALGYRRIVLAHQTGKTTAITAYACQHPGGCDKPAVQLHDPNAWQVPAPRRERCTEHKAVRS